MVDKVVGSLEEAVARIHSGASIAIGGFGRPGFPGDLLDALSKRDITDLHMIANGVQGDGVAKMVAEHRVRKLSAGFPFGAPWNAEVFAGNVEVEVLPQGTLSERLRAGGAGIAAFYTPTSIGTAIADGTFPKRFDEHGEPLEFVDPKEVREFDGRQYVLEHGIRPDFGLIRCTKADRLGNLYFRLTSRNFNPSIAMASRCTIVQAQEIVEPGDLEPDEIHVPGVFVDVLVHVPRDQELPPPQRPPSRNMRAAASTEERIGFSRDQIGENVARDIGEGWFVNLGTGMPLLTAKHVPLERHVTMHMENGILGAGGPPEVPDPDITNAGGEPVTLRSGAAIFDSALSFAIVRGGYIDLTVLGGLQVSAKGDLANWYMPKGQTGVGGAMDLVQGAKRVWVTMGHNDPNGNPKIVNECSYTLTGPGVVKRIYTDIAIFSLEDGELELIGIAPGISVDEVRARTEPNFKVRAGIE
jgi:3-oxoacid CoA-transferase